MAAPNPLTDPLYAYDTFGWTNQKTGDIPTTGASQGVVSPYDAELSGFLAATMDSAVVTTDAVLPATNVFYGSLIYIGGPSKSTQFYINTTTGGTTTHGYVALLTPNGTTVAASADLLAALPTTAASWAVSPVLASGYYYLGVAATWSVQPKFAGLPVLAVTSGNAAGLVWASGGPYPKYVTSASTVTISSSFPASVTLAAQSTLGTPFIAAI